MNADEQYQQNVKNRELEIQGELTTFDGTWYRVSYVELAVFNLDSDLFTALTEAYIRYEHYARLSEFWQFTAEQVEEDRQTHPDHESAVSFMSTVCNLPSVQCYAYHLFKEAQDVRGGILIEQNENFKDS